MYVRYVPANSVRSRFNPPPLAIHYVHNARATQEDTWLRGRPGYVVEGWAWIRGWGVGLDTWLRGRPGYVAEGWAWIRGWGVGLCRNVAWLHLQPQRPAAAIGRVVTAELCEGLTLFWIAYQKCNDIFFYILLHTIWFNTFATIKKKILIQIVLTEVVVNSFVCSYLFWGSRCYKVGYCSRFSISF